MVLIFFSYATYTGLVEVGAVVVVVRLDVVVAGLVVLAGKRVTGFIQLEGLHPRTLQVQKHIATMLGVLLQKAPKLLQVAIS